MRLYALRRHCQGQTLTYRQVQIFKETQTVTVRNILRAVASIYYITVPMYLPHHQTGDEKNQRQRQLTTTTNGRSILFLVGKSRRRQKASITASSRTLCTSIYACMHVIKELNPFGGADICIQKATSATWVFVCMCLCDLRSVWYVRWDASCANSMKPTRHSSTRNAQVLDIPEGWWDGGRR